MLRSVLLAVVGILMPLSFVEAQTREQKVLADRERVQAEGFWIYNDFPKGLAEAKRTGKPLLVVLRCIPCEECVKLDDDLIDQDPQVKPLLEKFVCVRLVSTNGLDLSLFQYDYDQSFAAFLMNADKVIYGRFGTRSDRTEWEDDVSIEGLAQALKTALEWHADYPANKGLFTAKKGPAPDVPSPENYAQLRGKYGPSLNYERNVVQSCIHCHQIGDAQRETYWTAKKPIPDQILFSYPHPKSQGLILDPHSTAKVLRVEADSPAAAAGFQAGDHLLKLGGQPLLSMADVQWVLHHTPVEGAKLPVEIRRGEKLMLLEWTLPAKWRERDDIAWRVTSWGLRRMVTGGMVMVPATIEERKAAGVSTTGMALRAQHVGQYGAHAAAKNAGFQKDDILVSIDGRTDFTRETDVIAWLVRNHHPGDRISIDLVRGGKRTTLKLPIQN